MPLNVNYVGDKMIYRTFRRGPWYVIKREIEYSDEYRSAKNGLRNDIREWLITMYGNQWKVKSSVLDLTFKNANKKANKKAKRYHNIEDYYVVNIIDTCDIYLPNKCAVTFFKLTWAL